ncbi:MAG: pilus assembly protein PilB [Planctomycetaceae bacterium]|nr:pilus assembly protein PilB [Planctomycetaceae bacterium]|tara:strand:+ start:8364 stop:10076 length:1713 start_codon:yes stop_codon:yes gene_type:complete
MAIRRIGQILVDLGFVTDDQLEALLEEQRAQPGEKLGKIAEDMALITDDQLAQALAEQMNMQVISLADTKLEPELMAMLTETMAQLYRVVPVTFEGNLLTVATAEPEKLTIQDELRTFLGHDVRSVVCTNREIQDVLDKFYATSEDSLESIITELEDDDDLKAQSLALTEGAVDLTGAEALADSQPVRKLLNMVLLIAIKDHASDIHFEPFEDEFKIRIKSDGVLMEMVPPPRHMAYPITTRIKVMANLDIAERRVPQDGRIELTVGGHPVDLRVSILPTMHGESVCMRILDRSVVSLDLKNVGMDDNIMSEFREVCNKPNGIILVTGPTGSGKTTTLYSVLSELNKLEDKLITTEDPVEYDIDGIVQIPIQHDIGVTFAACLRAILRQDPDRILVGEIRDLETAEIAVQASLTGHTVFSTLHTNDAPSSVTRLKDMGVPVFLITATVEAILAQRLVRRVCTQCREETEVTDDLLFQLDMSREELGDRKFYRGRGCDTCNNTGYKGRVGLFELMIMNNELRDMVMRNASVDDMRACAQKYGMVTLRDSGMAFAYEGTTTIDEVVRETIVD